MVNMNEKNTPIASMDKAAICKKVPKETDVNMKVNMRLTLMAEMLAKGHHQANIARELGISKVAICKAIKRMTASGFISESPESTYHQKFYHVNPILTMSEKRLTSGRYALIYDPHNYALKFTVAPDGQGSFPKTKKVTKRNWDAFYDQAGMVDFELTPKHLIASLGDQRLRFQVGDSKDVETATASVHSILILSAKDIVQRYNMIVDLNHPLLSRKELGITDPLISAPGLAYRAKKHKKVYPEINKIEFNDETALKNFVDNRILDNKIDQVLDIMDRFSVNIEKHLGVLDAQSETLKDIRDSLPRTLNANLSVKIDDPLIRIETVEPILSFVAEDRGTVRTFPDLNAGARIWIARPVAEGLMKQGKARLCSEK